MRLRFFAIDIRSVHRPRFFATRRTHVAFHYHLNISTMTERLFTLWTGVIYITVGDECVSNGTFLNRITDPTIDGFRGRHRIGWWMTEWRRIPTRDQIIPYAVVKKTDSTILVSHKQIPHITPNRKCNIQRFFEQTLQLCIVLHRLVGCLAKIVERSVVQWNPNAVSHLSRKCLNFIFFPRLFDMSVI